MMQVRSDPSVLLAARVLGSRRRGATSSARAHERTATASGEAAPRTRTLLEPKTRADRAEPAG